MAQRNGLLPLEGRVAIVTGAGRGIGRACALHLASLGADLVISDIKLASAQDFGESLSRASVADEVRALGRRALEVESDLTQSAAADALVQATLDAFGQVDILVNNAGGVLAPIETSLASTMSATDFDRIFDVNLRSMMYCAQAAVKPMRARGSGAIVNMASMAALDPAQRQGRLAHYGMTKTAAIQFTRFLASDVGPDGIRVNAIAPGTIATARIRQLSAARGIGVDADLQNIPLRRLGREEDIAGVVAFLVGDASAYVTGQCLSVCGGRVLTPS